VRRSRYVEVRDGTRIAIDVYRPTRAGQPHQEPLPVLFTFKRYQRAVVIDGQVIGEPVEADAEIDRSVRDGVTSAAQLMGEMEAGTLAAPSMRLMIGRERDMGRLLRRGYVIAAADSRGSGASFGTRSGPQKDMSPPVDAWDGYELVEWLASQEWCSGAVGMYGASYEGRLQLEVAATQPPHLKAIFPEVALVDWYWTHLRGGIYSPMIWPGPGDHDPLSAPVDEDLDGSLLRAALAEHEGNTTWSLAGLPYRNSWDAESGRAYYIDSDGFVLLDRIAAAGIAVYHVTGWWSIGPKWNTLAAFRHLTGRTPQRLMVGSWGSFVTDRGELADEMGRFADHWLKGIDTGIMDEAPIRFQTLCSEPAGSWRTASAWPLPGEPRTVLHLDAGLSGTVASANDGSLSDTRRSDGEDVYAVDYGIASPYSPVGTAALDHDFRADLDARGLTYTTVPLAADTEVSGHPSLTLWISSDADDVDVFAFVMDVDQDGRSSYISDGRLRASHRAVANPGFDNLGIAWHRSYAEDLRPLVSGEPVTLEIEMLPTSYLVRGGHRMRLTIVGAHDGFTTPVREPRPVLTVYRTSQRPSVLILPIVTRP
jgi:putative CocE/NonD family hydrolase